MGSGIVEDDNDNCDNESATGIAPIQFVLCTSSISFLEVDIGLVDELYN